MQRIIELSGRNFKLQAEGSAWEMGYGVSFERENGKRGTVQFAVHLTSSMKLISIPSRLHGSVSQAEIDICKEIVAQELETNPTVFHVAENGRTERDRFIRSLKQAEGFKQVASTDPEYIAVEQRIADLSAVIKASTAWAHDPAKKSYRQFLTEYRSSIDGSAQPVAVVPSTGLVQKPMGPIELVAYARKLEADVGSIVITPTGDALSRVPYGVAERRDHDWPLPWKLSSEQTKWVRFHRHDFRRDRSEQAKDILSREDTLVLAWTQRTDTAAFERITSVIGRYGNNPHMIIGSPEGSFSGRANDLRFEKGFGSSDVFSL